MALPWLTIVARSVPWAELVRRAPQIIAASSQLLDKRNAAGQRAAEPPGEPDERDLQRRIAALEDRDAEHARVFEQLAQQTQDLSVGLEVVAARLRLLMILFGVAVVAGLVAAVVLW